MPASKHMTSCCLPQAPPPPNMVSSFTTSLAQAEPGQYNANPCHAGGQLQLSAMSRGIQEKAQRRGIAVHLGATACIQQRSYCLHPAKTFRDWYRRVLVTHIGPFLSSLGHHCLPGLAPLCQSQSSHLHAASCACMDMLTSSLPARHP